MGLIAQYRTGATTEHHNPLPVGRYWLDIPTERVPIWTLWLAQSGFGVQVITTETYDSDPPMTWVLFDVKPVPIVWDKSTAISLGYPTHAGANVKTRDDTVDKPEPEPLIPDKYKWIEYAAFGLVGVIGIYSVAKLVRG